jgi:putative endonuclease
MKFYWVYMMANAHNTVLYVGMTNDLARRVTEHQQHVDPKSFTARYNVEKLVWHEAHDSALAAIAREKQVKNWKRAWKDQLIDTMNPERKDLSVGGLIG